MRLHLVLIPLVAALALAGCHKAAPSKTTDAQQARAVNIVQVLPRAITGALAASGDLVPREEAAVFPEVSGYRVDKVLVDVGSYVRKGQTLVQLDPALIQAQVAQAEANAAAGLVGPLPEDFLTGVRAIYDRDLREAIHPRW